MPTIKNKLIDVISWDEGYDAEYEYEIRIYEDHIDWHLEFDEQWSDAPRDATQTIYNFLQNGPPSSFSAVNSYYTDLVRKAVKDLPAAKVKDLSASALAEKKKRELEKGRKKVKSMQELKTGWERTVQLVPHGITVLSNEVVFYSGDAHTGSGASCSFAEFLDGKFHDFVLNNFGNAVLEEVIESVMLAPATEEHQKNVTEKDRLLNWIRAIPEDESLKAFEDQSNYDDNGYKHYGAAGKYTDAAGAVIKTCTRLKSKGVELIYGLTSNLAGEPQPFDWPLAYLIYKDGGKRSVEVGLQPNDGLAHKGLFYIVSGDTYFVIDSEGKHLEKEKDRDIFGERVRITGVVRIGKRICFKYSWYFDSDVPDGFLEFKNGHFIGRHELND